MLIVSLGRKIIKFPTNNNSNIHQLNSQGVPWIRLHNFFKNTFSEIYVRSFGFGILKYERNIKVSLVYIKSLLLTNNLKPSTHLETLLENAHFKSLYITIFSDETSLYSICILGC